ncbi:MAG: Tetratricopeptide repeat protein [Candidatus Sulfotelmatobacter sp.]|nr:Tetratricopeptide repeat protein [Candidatus Sulfotelmatobacter sp.]
MRSLLLPLLVASALTVPFTAAAQTGQTPSSSSLPAKAKKGAKVSDQKSPDPADSKPEVPKRDYSQEGFVVEQYRSTFRFESDGTGRRETVARIRVQSEAGVQQWGQIQIGYNSANERVEIAYVRVIKADGSMVKAGDDAVQDLTAPVEREAPVYTDYRQKHITVPGLRPGEVLEYDMVTVIHTPLAAGQFWADYDFDKNNIMLNEELDVDVPLGRPIKLKNKPGMDPKISEANGRRIYHWSSSHLEREDDEKDKDKDKSKKKKKKKKSDEERSDVQLTTFVSWEQIGRWYAGLDKDRRAPSPEVRAKAQELTKGLDNESDKIQALYDFVAKNFRYVSLSLGLGRYQPHAAGDVLHNQYGDCKDKHTLLASLLEAEGLHASSVLINSTRKLDPDVPSPAQFDHVITMLPVGQDEVWMDTTSEVAPFRLLAYSLRNKLALVIPADGTPHLEETPANTPMPDSEISEVGGKINEIGKLEAHVHYTFRGDEELMLRSIFRRVPEAQWQRVVENVNAGMGGEVTHLKISDPAATREPFTMSYDVAKPNFLDWSKKKSDLTLPLCQFNLPDLGVSDDSDVDAEPLKLGPKAEYAYKIKLELPAKYTAHAPLPFSLKRDYADYQATYKLEGKTFTASRTLTLRQDELPAPRAEDYQAFRHAVGSDLGQVLSVENTVAGAPTPPADMKADDLVESGRAAMNSGNLAMAVQLLKRATEVEPKNKYAWNILGAAYLGMRQNDNAIAALNKQIEINPYDEYAYNAMARAYWQERKYEEAVSAFNKQIEINPLDKFAHAGLGAMYSEWHKYAEAAPELEKATSLTPDNPELQVSLGDAYLNLGQDDKALATFDHAVEISATPLVWNNIAYQLSLKKSHLDRAQQYAESAVSATTAELRNVTLDRLTPQELPLVPSLIAYWDTLGWVYFTEGNLDKAEKYVAAAWGLGQHGEVGDHLGQIYEKEGKKDRALLTYTLATTGLRPIPETHERIDALVKSDAKLNDAAKNGKQDLQSMRSIDLGKAKETGSAEFFVLLSGGAGMPAKAEAVRFVSGEEKLKVFTEALRTAEYRLTFPDDTPVKILRRGILSCSAAGGNCTFVLMLPDDVRTVD